jgi:predicted AlkP superfamily phosphohydrolase/phosphomutase
VVWLIWDAAAHWAIRALLAEGSLPALARVAQAGVIAGARPPWPNCQTPPGLATLFTGVWPWLHGISGFSMPDPDARLPVTARRSGFDPASLAAEPIWSYAGRHGRRVVLTYIPWVITPDGAPPGCVFAAEGYTERIMRGAAIPLTDLSPGADGRLQLQLGPIHLALEPSQDQVAVELLPAGRRFVLKIDAADDMDEHELTIGPGMRLFLRIWRRACDGALLLLHSGLWQIRTAPASELPAFQDAAGPFVGEGLGFLYRQGIFGPRLAEGGDGAAERMLVRSIATAATHFQRAALSAAARHPAADLYICYQPCIDDIEHELIGWCDPHSRAYRPLIAAEAWAAVRSVYQLADRHLAALLEHFGEDCTIIISSDHGMAGMTDTIHVNEALRQAGLLAFDAAGVIDLTRTTILYHTANNGSLWLNDARRPGGIVPDERRDDVIARAIAVLRGLRNPETGEPVIHAIYPADGDAQAGWKPALGDLFLAAADGYELSAGQTANGQLIVPVRKSASHATNPDRASLRGIFAARGPGIDRNRDLGEIDNRDLFPLLCRQLGMKPPPGLEGSIPAGLIAA